MAETHWGNKEYMKQDAKETFAIALSVNAQRRHMGGGLNQQIWNPIQESGVWQWRIATLREASDENSVLLGYEHKHQWLDMPRR